ncbi:hypothetical protein Tco_0155016 [Tanacetum coccineum]
MDLPQANKFFRAFTSVINNTGFYIQQFFWIHFYDSKAGSYSYTDEQCLSHSDTLRDAASITPVDNTGLSLLLPTPDTLVELVNKLGYPKRERLLDIERRERAPMLTKPLVGGCQSSSHRLWLKGRKRIYSIHPHLHRRQKEVGTTYSGEEENNSYPYPKYQFSAKEATRIFGMTIPNELINNVIRGADYYDAYLEKVAKHQRYIAAKKSKHAPAKPKEKKRKPVSESSEAQPLAKRAKAGKVVKKRTVKSSKQLVDEFVDEGVPAAKPSLEDTKEAILNKCQEGERESRRETSGPRFFSTYKLQEKRAQMTIQTSETDTESDEEMPSVVRSGAQDEGQAGSDPGTRDEGQAGPNPDDVAESLPLPTPCVLAGPNLEHSDDDYQRNCQLTGTLSSLQHLAKDFSFGDQFLNDKPSEADNEKTTADTEAESMVLVTIQQDTSIIPPMTSPVIDLVTRPDSPNFQWPLPTTTTTTAAPPPPPTTTTTTTTLPLPPQPQQGSSDSILIKRIGELEQHIADLVEENQALETRLDKQGNRIHKMETMDWPKMIREQTVEKFLPNMLEENYDKGHANHRVAYEALQDFIHRDEVEDFDVDKAQEETKRKSAIGGPLAQPEPADLLKAPPLLTILIHSIGKQSTSHALQVSSKTAASAEYSAWTTTDTRVKPSSTTIPDELYMDDENQCR